MVDLGVGVGVYTKGGYRSGCWGCNRTPYYAPKVSIGGWCTHTRVQDSCWRIRKGQFLAAHFTYCMINFNRVDHNFALTRKREIKNPPDSHVI